MQGLCITFAAIKYKMFNIEKKCDEKNLLSCIINFGIRSLFNGLVFLSIIVFVVFFAIFALFVHKNVSILNYHDKNKNNSSLPLSSFFILACWSADADRLVGGRRFGQFQLWRYQGKI